MPSRHPGSALIITVAAALLAAACEESSVVTPAAPTRFAAVEAPAVALAVRPAVLFRRSVVGAVCPFRQPFFVPFNLVIGAPFGNPLFLNQVRMQFFDSLGAAGPRITIPQPDLLTHFGTIQIPPDGSRSFPFSFDFGCATQPVGTLSLFVQTIDARQTTIDKTVTVAIR